MFSLTACSQFAARAHPFGPKNDFALRSAVGRFWPAASLSFCTPRSPAQVAFARLKVAYTYGALIERSRLLFRPFSALDSLLRLILRIEMAGSLPDDTDDTTTTFISNTKEVVLTLTEAPLRNYIRLYCFVARAARSQSTLLTWTIKRRECPPQGGSSRTLRRLTSVPAHTYRWQRDTLRVKSICP